MGPVANRTSREGGREGVRQAEKIKGKREEKKTREAEGGSGEKKTTTNAKAKDKNEKRGVGGRRMKTGEKREKRGEEGEKTEDERQRDKKSKNGRGAQMMSALFSAAFSIPSTAGYVYFILAPHLH